MGVVAAGLGLLAGAGPVAAQEHEHDPGEEHEHACAIHFVHPLFAESISVDTKARLDFVAATPGSARDLEGEGEYAVGCSFSAELGLHYHLSDGDFGDGHVLLKAVSGRFASRGVSVGYGVSFGFPVRSEAAAADEAAADDHEESYHIAPFVNGGIKSGPLEVVGWTFYTVHTGSLLAERRGTSMDGSVSGLLFVTSRVAAVLELLGSRGIGGEEDRSWNVSIAPGLKLESLGGVPGLALGAGVELPVSGEQGYDARFLASAFFHF
jgi:hypothetical protein